MAQTLIISRDPAIRTRGESSGVTWADSCGQLDQLLATSIDLVLVDLNTEWDQDLPACIAKCKALGAGKIIAFLHEQAGEKAIKAHLAGADRVIPQNQLEDEWDELVRG